MPDNSMVNVIPSKTSFTGDGKGFVRLADSQMDAAFTVKTLVETADIADKAITTAKVNTSPATGILHNAHTDTANSLSWGLVVTDDITADNVTIDKLDASTRAIIEQTPQFERGISNSIEVPANSAVDGEITFSTTKVDTPQVFITIEDATGTNFSTVITSVDTSEFHYRVINNSNSDASGVTINWLALSGR